MKIEKNKFITLTRVKVVVGSESEFLVTLNAEYVVLFEPDGNRTRIFLSIQGGAREVLVNEDFEQVYQMITGRVFLK